MRVAVGFDFDHTLGIDNHLERVAFGKLAEQLGVPLDVKKPAIANLIEELLVPFRVGEESMVDMLVRFIATLEGVECVESAHEVALRYREICYTLVDELVKPMPGANDCIAKLVEDGVAVGILTNGWSELQERKIERALGAFPGPILVSEALGAYKPSAKAFLELEKALGVSPAELWYVGDNPAADISGALAYGLRAVWLNSNGAVYPPELTPPTVEIENLRELPAVIRGA